MRQTAMHVRTQVTHEDYEALTRFISMRARDFPDFPKHSWRSTGIPLATWAIFLVAMPVLAKFLDVDLRKDAPLLLATVLMCAVSFVYYLAFSQPRLYPSEDGPFLGRQELEVLPDRLVVSNELVESKYSWAAISEFCETPDHFFLLVDRCAAIIVPRRNLESEGEADEFTQLVNRLVSAA